VRTVPKDDIPGIEVEDWKEGMGIDFYSLAPVEMIT
jgi:hypothetical protein